MDTVILYITTPGKNEAARLARELLEARLIACANIIEGITSHFRWEGKLQETNECLLLAKTACAKVEPAIEVAKKLHPYECPCIVALPLEAGHAPFLHWVAQETA